MSDRNTTRCWVTDRSSATVSSTVRPGWATNRSASQERWSAERSIPDEEEARAYWAVFAAVRSGRPDAGDETRRLLVDVFEVWSRRLSQSVGDPVTADLMRLVGDGLYLAAVTGLPLPERERLDAVFDRLVERDPATQGGADPAGRDAL